MSASQASTRDHPPSPTIVTVGSARVAAQIEGEGPPLVLFHSLLADRSSFDRVMPLLTAYHRVVALDLPGFGASDPAPGGLDAVADRVVGALEALRLDAKPIFLGNGYGGFVALLAAIRHPDAAARLVLADCGAAFDTGGRAAFTGMSAAAGRGGLEAVADVAMQRLFAADYQARNPELIAARKARFLALDPATFHAACQALATLDLRADLANLRMPVLVLVGEADQATPPAMSRELAAGLPDARLEVLPGCAHVPQLQEPAQFYAAIERFIGAAERSLPAA